MKKLIINAINIHQGGGCNLLLALLQEIKLKKLAYAFLDERINQYLDKNLKLNIKFIPPSIWERFIHEIYLFFNVKKNDILLCFGNLPPLFKSQGHVILFIQNRYLLENINLSAFPLNVKIRIIIEKLWLRLRISNVDMFVVQTQSMSNLLLKINKYSKPIKQIAFTENDYLNFRHNKFLLSKKIQDNFIYIASGEPHKNHKNLILAWCLLAEGGLFPKLTITLDFKKYKNLCNWIDSRIIKSRINIINVGFIDSAKVKVLYSKSTALIYPSNLESFGLPLIEAKAMNLKILAPELDYVRDLIDPDEVFDPDSPLSIARSVKRFINKPENRLPIKSAKQFLTELQIS